MRFYFRSNWNDIGVLHSPYLKLLSIVDCSILSSRLPKHPAIVPERKIFAYLEL
jgi:hypothetical protein